jgi:hypothetical protein
VGIANRKEREMDTLGQIIGGIGGLGMLVCYIMFIVTMFQRGATGLAILFLVLSLCCGVGLLVAFIYGWIKHREWGITNLMMIWSVFIGMSIIGGVLSPTDYQAQLQRFQS